MTDTLEAIARSLAADVRSVNMISHNVANLNTPGFRAGRAMTSFAGALNVTTYDLRDGALVQTGRPLDLALQGPGFFIVERDGANVLVRAGDLRIDAEGRLVDGTGGHVLSHSGPLVPGAAALRVAEDGSVTADGREIDRLRIVDVADPARLQPASGGGFLYDGEFAEWRGRVVAGAIERANVDAAEQTVTLMEVGRHAESVQRAIAIYDKTLDAGINRLGEN